MLRAVAAVGRLQIRGPGWERAPADLPVAGGPVHGRRLAEVIRGAAISLGANAHPEQDADRASASNRMWKILGCGGFYLGPLGAGHRALRRGRTALRLVPLARPRPPSWSAHYLAQPEERGDDRGGGAGARARGTTPTPSRLELLLAGREYELDRPASDDACSSGTRTTRTPVSRSIAPET